jgi:hypothetical protein
VPPALTVTGAAAHCRHSIPVLVAGPILYVSRGPLGPFAASHSTVNHVGLRILLYGNTWIISGDWTKSMGGSSGVALPVHSVADHNADTKKTFTKSSLRNFAVIEKASNGKLQCYPAHTLTEAQPARTTHWASWVGTHGTRECMVAF